MLVSDLRQQSAAIVFVHFRWAEVRNRVLYAHLLLRIVLRSHSLEVSSVSRLLAYQVIDYAGCTL